MTTRTTRPCAGSGTFNTLPCCESRVALTLVLMLERFLKTKTSFCEDGRANLPKTPASRYLDCSQVHPFVLSRKSPMAYSPLRWILGSKQFKPCQETPPAGSSCLLRLSHLGAFQARKNSRVNPFKLSASAERGCPHWLGYSEICGVWPLSYGGG